MKNVFGDTSDSNSESELEPETKLPPPKKLKIPGSSPMGSEKYLKKRFPLHGFGVDDSKVTEESIDFLQSDDELFDDKEVSQHNKKASLEKSILNPESIGFKIMTKMGYAMGDNIGSTNSLRGLAEPITVKQVEGKSGLGAKSFERNTIANGSTEISSSGMEEFRKKYKLNQVKSTTKKLQNFCFIASGEEALLESGAISITEVNELWRESASYTVVESKRTRLFGESKNASTDKEAAPDSTSNNKLLYERYHRLIEFSRSNYFYCPFCGVQYNDFIDLSSNCPGNSDSDHEF